MSLHSALLPLDPFARPPQPSAHDEVAAPAEATEEIPEAIVAAEEEEPPPPGVDPPAPDAPAAEPAPAAEAATESDAEREAPAALAARPSRGARRRARAARELAPGTLTREPAGRGLVRDYD